MFERVRRLGTPFLLCMAAYAFLLATWLAAQPLPPLQDYMDWVYQGWVGAQWLHGFSPVRQQFAPVPYPVPNAASQVLLAGVTGAVGALLASKIVIALLLAAFAVVCMVASARFRWAGPAALVLFLCFGANSTFWDGYVNYQLSLLVFLCFLPVFDRLSGAAVAFLGTLLFFCHATTFFAFVMLVGFDALFYAERRKRVLALLPSLALLAWYVAARREPVAAQGPAAPLYSGLLHHLAYKVYTLSKLGPFHNLVDYADRSLMDRFRGWYLLGVALNLLFAAGLGLVLLDGVWRGARRGARREPWTWAGMRSGARTGTAAGNGTRTGTGARLRDPGLWTASLLLLLFLILPGKLLGVVNIGERLLYPALLLLLLRLRELRGLPALAALGCCGAGLTAAQLFTMSTAHPGSPASPETTAASRTGQYYDQYGLYSSRLYEFDLYRVFLERPDTQDHAGQLPVIGFDTSLFVDRLPGESKEAGH